MQKSKQNSTNKAYIIYFAIKVSIWPIKYYVTLMELIVYIIIFIPV